MPAFLARRERHADALLVYGVLSCVWLASLAAAGRRGLDHVVLAHVGLGLHAFHHEPGTGAFAPTTTYTFTTRALGSSTALVSSGTSGTSTPPSPSWIYAPPSSDTSVACSTARPAALHGPSSEARSAATRVPTRSCCAPPGAEAGAPARSPLASSSSKGAASTRVARLAEGVGVSAEPVCRPAAQLDQAVGQLQQLGGLRVRTRAAAGNPGVRTQGRTDAGSTIEGEDGCIALTVAEADGCSAPTMAEEDRCSAPALAEGGRGPAAAADAGARPRGHYWKYPVLLVYASALAFLLWNLAWPSQMTSDGDEAVSLEVPLIFHDGNRSVVGPGDEV
ncbi:unnamed protein product [Prorocentrum cordatum]|uniref:Uncharacterized protein n=1 Tax=Prorocentrum cordatum TaxID=2364126 RepID=A0ABN9TZ49_9DINO|nr:unnamed protein product [Polarella glacialis]